MIPPSRTLLAAIDLPAGAISRLVPERHSNPQQAQLVLPERAR